MNWPTLVAASQVLSALAWLAVSHHYVGSFARVLRRRPLIWDAAGCWAFIMGLVQTGFTVRWLTFGSNDVQTMSEPSLRFWVVLYVANAAVAIGILYTWRTRDADSAGPRALVGVGLWAAIFMASAGLVWSVG